MICIPSSSNYEVAKKIFRQGGWQYDHISPQYDLHHTQVDNIILLRKLLKDEIAYKIDQTISYLVHIII